MQNKLVTTVATATVLVLSLVNADLCSQGSIEIDGNWYCQSVQAIQYSNVGTPGTYNQVTDMPPDGNCASTPFSFSGPLAPLDEEVSLHFRGPLQLKQFAAYNHSASSQTKREVVAPHAAHHGHQNFHLPQKSKTNKVVNDPVKRQVVVATIDGEVVSWENNWYGGAVPTTPVEVSATIDGQLVSWVNNWFGPSSAVDAVDAVDAVQTDVPGESVPDSAPTTLVTVVQPTYPGDEIPETSESLQYTTTSSGIDNTYTRIGYYNSESQTLDNLVFLGNYGGQGSGCFDYTYGASLAYANSAGTGGAASPQILADCTIPSATEVIIFLNQECGATDCGYVRPGSVAYHGFDGADKVFLFEFSMPFDEDSGFEGDMPAIWMLNAQIPRTLQYGNADCSCWESGCGEFDIAEILDSGSTFMKSTLHTNTPGGDSDYIDRPTSGSIQLAVVFSSTTSTICIQVLPNGTDFSSSLTAGQIEEYCSSSTGLSTFSIVA